MKKKLLSILLAAVMVLSLIPAITVSASATSPKITITSGSFEGYKGWLKANDGKDRYTQRANPNTLRNDISKAYDNDPDTSANSYGTNEYFPEIYLNASGELTRDNTYDNVNEDVVLSDYLASGKGKYYGVFKFTLAGLSNLDTVTVSDWYEDATDSESMHYPAREFDILYSANGTNWTVAASYTGMSDPSKWTLTYFSSGWHTATVDTDMSGAEALYVAVAIRTPSDVLTNTHDMRLYEITVTGTPAVAAPALVEVGTEAELREAIAAYGSSTTTTIKLTSDLIMTGGNVGEIAGTFDGQNHVIYNLQDNSFISPLAGATVKNFTVSDKTAPDGAVMSGLTGRFSVLTWELPGGTSVQPTYILNVHNQRSTSNVDNYLGAFTYRINDGNYVVFENCSNSGSISTMSGINAKVGGFVGTLKGNATFINCSNSGNITSSAAGGFVGAYSGVTTITMTGCTNTGTITGVVDGSAYGIAGGLLGGVSNGAEISGATTVTLTSCTNSGDVTVRNDTDAEKEYGVGGLIGHAGGSADGKTCTVTLNNCGVYNCTIDASAGTSFAAPLIGKCSPGSLDNYIITAYGCYVNDVDVIAVKARKLIGVGSAIDSTRPNAYNCVLNDVIENGSEEWNGSKYSNLNVALSSTNYFVDTDTANAISDGFAPAYQLAAAAADTTKVRFLATLKDGALTAYEKVGFFVTASYSTTVKGWNLNSTTVYSSVVAAGVDTNASAIYDGHGSEAYIFVATLEGINIPPQDVTFNVTPYVVNTDGSVLFGLTGQYVISVGSL
ncbi:MAG: hypothetical protein J5885_00705 [Clostridia bacterium]|nr:hypothetical protein [Clostridia bacterium]